MRLLHRDAARNLPERPARRRYPAVLPKFRNPAEPHQTWSGRGKRPHWVTELLDAGRSIQDFQISEYDTVAVVIVRQSHSITDDRDDYRAMAGSNPLGVWVQVDEEIARWRVVAIKPEQSYWIRKTKSSRYCLASAAAQNDLRKTTGRISQFLGDALAGRASDRQHLLVAWGLVAGAAWLMGSLAGAPAWPALTLAGVYLVVVLAAVCAIDARYGIIPDSLVLALAVGGVLQTSIPGQGELLQRGFEALVLFLAAACLFRLPIAGCGGTTNWGAGTSRSKICAGRSAPNQRVGLASAPRSATNQDQFHEAPLPAGAILRGRDGPFFHFPDRSLFIGPVVHQLHNARQPAGYVHPHRNGRRPGNLR